MKKDTRFLSGLSTMWATMMNKVVPAQRQELELNNALFLGIFSDVPDAMMVSDKARKVVMVNPAFMQMFGYTQDEAFGTSVLDFYVAPEDFCQPSQVHIEGESNFIRDPYEISFKRKDGTTFLGETFGTPIEDAQGNLTANVVIVRDISERRKVEKAMWASEKRLRTIMDAIPSMIFVKNAESRFLAANKAVADNLGLPLNQVVGERHGDLYPYPKDMQRMAEDDRKVIENGGKLHVAQQPYHDKDGNLGWLQSVKVACDSDAFGEPALVGNAVDITKLKEIEDDLRRTKTEAEDANKAKSEFLSAMSHELRTPLNAILGFAQMLQYDPKSKLSEAQDENVNHILDSAEHLLGLVNEILDLERIEADQFVLSVGEVDPTHVICDCIKLIEPQAQKRNIRLANKVAGQSYTPMRTDAVRLRQVLMNLLSNAVKYNKPGGSVIVEGQENEHGFLRISITDSGVGIPEKDKKEIFQAFHRAGADPFLAREGTGIGLTVAQLLAERMAGQIGLHSTEGEGSTFWVEIPLTNNKETLLWTDNMRVGVEAVDKDHQVLVSLLNKTSQRNVEADALEEVMDSLIDYTQYHFRREELIMEICNYPDREAHMKIHERLCAQVMELADAWRRERSLETLTTLRAFLRNWLSDHIMNVDTTLTPHTKGKGKAIRAALEELKQSA
ncbi:bacteriohemerythrin [Magnetovibrio sp. PR-2]|uniref:bacteriohemerythrin n=1 Tax=Magnetovibrio sp. PR-2 TaxID=3120356 RepID=UPI002FCDEA9F